MMGFKKGVESFKNMGTIFYLCLDLCLKVKQILAMLFDNFSQTIRL